MSEQQHPAPVSDEAYQQVLDQSESYEQAAITAYTAGFFDGEGSISATPSANRGPAGTEGHGIKTKLRITLIKHQIAGLFDGEGCISAGAFKNGSRRLGHSFTPRVNVEQASDETILHAIASRYSSVAGFDYNIYERQTSAENESDTESLTIQAADDIEAFLRPIIPLLGEKRRQAQIMVNEFLPAYRQGKHHTKEGFIEMMKIKRRLDEQKPMGNDQRQHTVEKYQDMWADDIEAQTALTDHTGGADQ
jgi:hypothetical protein